MDYKTLIELYLGREFTIGHQFVDGRYIEKEVGLIDYGNGNEIQISFWNITDKPQPTIAELESLQPQLDIQEYNANIKAQIVELESTQLRSVRELIVDSTNEIAKEKLATIEGQIVELRTQLI